MIDNVIILAGGSGTRLWPVSSNLKPKQFINIEGSGKTLLSMTLDRAAALASRRIMIITLKTQTDLVEKELRAWKDRTSGKLPELCILSEPEARNTAPAITAGMAWIHAMGGRGEANLVLPSDHLVSPLSALEDDTVKASALAHDGYLVTFGIRPSRPETGYGYIKSGDSLGKGFRVGRFCEKPDSETAQTFVADGGYYWNSGMFVFRTDVFLDELAEHSPECAHAFSPVGSLTGAELTREDKGIFHVLDGSGIHGIYKAASSVSVDYAVMEKTAKAAMVSASFDWNDVGSWDEYSRLYDGLSSGLWEIDCRNNFVYSDIPVALVGVKDLVVVVKDGKVLVCKKGSSQDVKAVIDQLKEQQRDDLL